MTTEGSTSTLSGKSLASAKTCQFAPPISKNKITAKQFKKMFVALVPNLI